MFLTRPFIDKYSSEKNSKKTNAFSIIGKEAIVTEDIDSIKWKRSNKNRRRNLVCKNNKNEINIQKGTEVEV